MSSLNQSSPVTKTAFDSIQAKQSAVAAGYEGIVVRNEENYKTMLSAVTAELKMKRQTPLVNAGYASRILTISYAINSFILYHEMTNSKRIQIVLLGCGADVIGLWAHSLSPSRVTVLEVDTPEVCSSKSDILIHQQLIAGTQDDSGRLIGRIQFGSNSDSQQNNYFLCPVDLRDIRSLNSVVTEYFDVCTPTLVISELVLSYLAPSQSDSILSWIASTICKTSGSCFVALESISADASSSVLGPVEGYKQQYNDQFGEKMERGLSSSGKPGKAPQTFCSIGSSCNVVKARFLDQGFDQVHTCHLGTVAMFASLPGPFKVPEIFDEHAAFTLHLKSYAVVFGYSAGTEVLMRRNMCPWDFAAAEVVPELKSNTALTVIEQMDESSVRDLVLEVYKEKFEDYPAVQKMVSHMMKSDLAISETTDEESAIASRFRDLGGIFFVAVEYNRTTRERKVVGCVGARPWERKVESRTLEVVRMAVNPNNRGKGVGRNLLEMVEKFARSRGLWSNLVATTISILDGAKRLYETSDYHLEKETALGRGLSMLTYKKVLHQQAE